VRYLIIHDINVENTIDVLKFKLAVERVYNRGNRFFVMKTFSSEEFISQWRNIRI